MKSAFMIISSFLIICLLPYSLLKGQDKKNEQKIKIIITDDSGTKVIIDTLIKDGSINDSLRLGNGKVILFNHPEDVKVMKHGGNEHMFVTVTSDGNESKKDIRTITIVSSDSSDSATWTEKAEVSDNDKDSSVEKTRYVIAKDGIVVSVEGNDEAKVKDLIKEIENKMGVKSGDSGKKESVTVETKKSAKK